MNTVCYLVYIEARTLFSDTRLAAAQILVEVRPEAVTALMEKSGEKPTSSNEIHEHRFSSAVAERAMLNYAHTEFPISSHDSYTYHIDGVSNPQLITSRVAPTAETDGCRLWLLKKHEFPREA
jgi:hypothetical protein